MQEFRQNFDKALTNYRKAHGQKMVTAFVREEKVDLTHLYEQPIGKTEYNKIYNKANTLKKCGKRSTQFDKVFLKLDQDKLLNVSCFHIY